MPHQSEMTQKTSTTPRPFPYELAISGAFGRGILAGLLNPLNVAATKIQDLRLNNNGVPKNPFNGLIPYIRSNPGLKEIFAGVIPNGSHKAVRDFFRLGIVFSVDRNFGSSEGDVRRGVLKATFLTALDLGLSPLSNLITAAAQNHHTGSRQLFNQYQAAARSNRPVTNALQVAFPPSVMKYTAPKQATQSFALMVAGDSINKAARNPDGTMSSNGAALSAVATGAIAALFMYPWDWLMRQAQLRALEGRRSYYFQDGVDDFKKYFSAARPYAGPAFFLRIGAATLPVTLKAAMREQAQVTQPQTTHHPDTTFQLDRLERLQAHSYDANNFGLY